MTADGSTGAIIFPMRAAPVGAPAVASSARDEERQSGWDGSPDDATLAPTRHDVAGEALASGEGSGEPRHAAPILLRTSEGIPAELDAQATGAAPPPLGETRVAHFVLGREHYRRSEESWDEAGRPTASVAVGATRDAIVIDVWVPDPSPVFAPSRLDNPLDNEHPDINSDGVQLYLGALRDRGRYYAWILVPEGDEGRVRVTPRAAFGPAVSLAASARLTPTGWSLRTVFPRAALAASQGFTLDVIVNEIAPGRERRRGQLVLSGGRDEWIYLRGDRQDPARAIAFQLSDD